MDDLNINSIKNYPGDVNLYSCKVEDGIVYYKIKKKTYVDYVSLIWLYQFVSY